MSRKGWDNLSDDYRARLIRRGVSEHDYRSGTPLQGARGYQSPQHESFMKRSAAFARKEAKTTKRHGTGEKTTAANIRRHIRSMGPAKGEKYMRDVRKMTRLYESGHVDEAQEMWDERDMSVPDYLYFYHGIFGF